MPAPIYLGRTLTRAALFSEATNEGVSFQFNPLPLVDNKGFNWIHRQYTGRPDSEPIWISGGERTFEFETTFDTTPGAKYSIAGGNISLNPRDIESSYSALAVPDNLGTLSYTEALQAMRYPPSQDGDTRTKFVNNGVIVNNSRFAAPPTVVFSYGPIVLYCKFSDLRIEHTAVDHKLVPTRSKCTIKLTVIEGLIVDSDISAENPEEIVDL